MSLHSACTSWLPHRAWARDQGSAQKGARAPARLGRGTVAYLAALTLGLLPGFLRAAEPTASTPVASTTTSETSTAGTTAENPTSGASAHSPVTDEAVIQSINTHLRNGWKESQLGPSGKATDGEWCRRVHLDLIGRIPTVAETEQFLADKSVGKRARLVARLLESEEYAEAYAHHWTIEWTNLLIGRRGGSEPRSLVARAGLEQYLHDAFLQNRPYDQLAQELIAADGVNKPGEADYNGAVNFLLGNLDDNAVQATAKTARIFLGMQVQCTQCHDHPFNTWKQTQFWGLNAFFRQTRALRTMDGTDILSVRLADEDFAGRAGDPKDAPISFEERRGTAVIVYPTFIDGTVLPNPSGYVEDVNRRDELARQVAASPELARALVNRVWGHFFGYGFTKPVDDMGPHNPPSHPELLDELAEQVRAGGYNFKRLLRWIASSEAYNLSSSATGRNAEDDPSSGAVPRFSHFYLRQMSAEQLYTSLQSIIAEDQAAGWSPEQQAAQRTAWIEQFVFALGTDEGDEVTTFDGTIPQALMLMNGDLVQKALSLDEGSFLSRLAHSGQSEQEQIQHLYLASVSRLPSRRELELDRQLLVQHADQPAQGLQDIWWALINSNEFLFNH